MESKIKVFNLLNLRTKPNPKESEYRKASLSFRPCSSSTASTKCHTSRNPQLCIEGELNGLYQQYTISRKERIEQEEYSNTLTKRTKILEQEGSKKNLKKLKQNEINKRKEQRMLTIMNDKKELKKVKEEKETLISLRKSKISVSKEKRDNILHTWKYNLHKKNQEKNIQTKESWNVAMLRYIIEKDIEDKHKKQQCEAKFNERSVSYEKKEEKKYVKKVCQKIDLVNKILHERLLKRKLDNHVKVYEMKNQTLHDQIYSER